MRLWRSSSARTSRTRFCACRLTHLRSHVRSMRFLRLLGCHRPQLCLLPTIPRCTSFTLIAGCPHTHACRRKTQPLNLGPIHVGSAATSPLSPRSQENGLSVAEAPWMKQTPLQRNLAHLARHGFNGVSSGPGDNGGSDSFSEESPRNSVVTVGNHPAPTFSGAASVTASTLGSIGSIKGRFSKFGSLNFGRRDG